MTENKNNRKVLKLPIRRKGVHITQFTPGPIESVNGELRETFIYDGKGYIKIPFSGIPEIARYLRNYQNSGKSNPPE